MNRIPSIRTALRPLENLRGLWSLKLLWCLAFGAWCFLLIGCSTPTTSSEFTALRVSNSRGDTISEYTARGPIHSVEGGYRITAVERWSPAPYRQYSRFPYGWRTTVIGPRIHHWRAAKPAWLSGEEADEDWEPVDDVK